VRHELVKVVRLGVSSRIAVQHRRSARVSGQQGRQCSEVAGVGVRVTVWGEPTRARPLGSTREGGEPLRYGDAGRRLDLPGRYSWEGYRRADSVASRPRVTRLRRVRRRAVEMPAPPSGQLSWRGGGVECDRGLSDGWVESGEGSAAEGGDGALGIAGVDDVDAVVVDAVLDAGTERQKGV